ncbi:hypothetical protein B0H17DRAFT_1269862 [Mycena rosella]|uniref:Uncharacterized protein n=1 Tax=Mycena rosella TaxID=1033263 RepID=A0AAD7FZN5_MYCRO|nr:hypothetical protein B0H17DRAFT_1269862 [Mycena rosella]
MLESHVPSERLVSTACLTKRAVVASEDEELVCSTPDCEMEGNLPMVSCRGPVCKSRLNGSATRNAVNRQGVGAEKKRAEVDRLYGQKRYDSDLGSELGYGSTAPLAKLPGPKFQGKGLEKWFRIASISANIIVSTLGQTNIYKYGITRLGDYQILRRFTMDNDTYFHLQQLQDIEEHDSDDEFQLAGATCTVILAETEETRQRSIERRHQSRLWLCRPQLMPNPRQDTPWQVLIASGSDRDSCIYNHDGI